MTTLGESLREAQCPIGSSVAPKFTMVMGNWDVRTMYVTGASVQVAKEMREYRIDILGIWR